MSYKDNLLEFIQNYHPEMLDDKISLKKFIDDRVEAAGKQWEQSIKEGNHPSLADEEASQILYAGLDFAPIEMLSYLAEEMECEPSWEEMLLVYPKVKHIIEKYPTEKDDFASEDNGEFQQLKNEIKQYIEANGLFKETTPTR